MSSYSANTISNLSLDPGLFCQVPQGAPSVFDKVRRDSRPPSHKHELTFILTVVHEPHPGSPFPGVHQEGLKFPVTPDHPQASGSLCWTMFINFINDKGQRVLPKRLHRFQKTETDPAATLSWSYPSLRSDEKPGVSQSRYSCSICNLDYAQPQGLSRHQYEKHKARLCIYCREFAWGRPYLFRKHLVKRHPGIDPDAAIDEAARTRRGVTIRRRYPPLPQVPIPTPKCDSWDRAESQSRPNQLTSSPARPSTVTRLSPVFLPEMAYDSQSESTEPPNKETHRQEGALSSELLNADDERAASPSTGEHAEAATNLDMSARTVQLWFKDKKQSVSPVGFTAVDGPSNLAPALAPVPTPTPPLNGYGSPVVVLLSFSAGLSGGKIRTNAFAPAPYRV
ncbi:hypothetical protein F5888DRAFT_1634852 [Russula emetica]|nr:hypothetical protein F5888DRAFT_1634852 [Russula emetica]